MIDLKRIDISKLPFHPAANLLPFRPEMIPAVMKRIEKYGPTNVWMDRDPENPDALIVDGRHQWVACDQLGIAPALRELKCDSFVDFVLTTNGEARRHCTVAELAYAAAQAEPLYAAEARQRMESGKKPDPAISGSQGSAAKKAGEKLGVSEASVRRMKRLLKDAPKEIQRAVKAGKLSLAKAIERMKTEKRIDEVNKGNTATRQKFADQDFQEFTETYVKAIRKLTGDRADEWQALAEKHRKAGEMIALVASARANLENVAIMIEERMRL